MLIAIKIILRIIAITIRYPISYLPWTAGGLSIVGNIFPFFPSLFSFFFPPKVFLFLLLFCLWVLATNIIYSVKKILVSSLNKIFLKKLTPFCNKEKETLSNFRSTWSVFLLLLFITIVIFMIVLPFLLFITGSSGRF